MKEEKKNNKKWKLIGLSLNIAIKFEEIVKKFDLHKNTVQKQQYDCERVPIKKNGNCILKETMWE